MRYILFAGETYYASGGAHDYMGQSNEEMELRNYPSLDIFDWWHILDTETGLISSRSESQAHGAPEDDN